MSIYVSFAHKRVGSGHETYSGRSNDGYALLLSFLDELLCLVLWNALSNDGNRTKLWDVGQVRDMGQVI